MIQNLELIEDNLQNNGKHNTSNYKDINSESNNNPSQSGNQSLISNLLNNNHKSKSNSIKESTTTSSTMAKSHLKQLKKNSSNSNENDNNNNILIENKEPILEPIMEAPPLSNIIKKNDVYEFYINNPDKNTTELFFKNNTISTTYYINLFA